MWKEFTDVLKQNEQALRSNQRLPYKRIFGPTERIADFSYQVLIIIGRPHYFPVVDVDSQVGSYLVPVVRGMTEFSLPFHELVNHAYALRLFDQYSTMGFISPDNKFIGPDQAVKEAEKVEPHKGEVPRRAGRESNLPPTSANLKDGIWHHIPTGTEFPIRDDLYRSGAGGRRRCPDFSPRQ
jgi:hypothetical protein